MKDEIYTVDQVAGMLNLHPKTIRRFIRDGKINACKIGKEWRITGLDLKNFLGSENINAINHDTQKSSLSLNDNEDHQMKQKIQVSAVVDILVNDVEEATRISNTIFAVMNCKDPSYGVARCDHIFYKDEMKARYFLWGTPRFIGNMLDCISAIAENKQ